MTVLCMFTGIGRGKHYRNPDQGLTLKHFVMGGIAAALMLIGGLILLVRWIAADA
ncbi:DUF2970 domain-containing protein [Chitinimonas koreensis]|uniref:DUF2970 domain-containing protein n=1 Tax=Chitinimonas koreensis TaxID=356302 RepID=UPI00041217C9|nr:DUF2970 domain-containing protein [Chitinimonas koreensis]QNM98422.1 DUF2970 domain-containing protein [Chitinimonas koreensis]